MEKRRISPVIFSSIHNKATQDIAIKNELRLRNSQRSTSELNPQLLFPSLFPYYKYFLLFLPPSLPLFFSLSQDECKTGRAGTLMSVLGICVHEYMCLCIEGVLTYHQGHLTFILIHVDFECFPSALEFTRHPSCRNYCSDK